jgi:hypothetical protein
LFSVTSSNQSASLVWTSSEDPLAEVLLIQDRLQNGLFNRTDKRLTSIGAGMKESGLAVERLQENPIARSMVDSIIGNLAGSLDSQGRIRPRLLEMFELEDWMLNRALIVLLVYFIVYRFLSYVVIRWKSNRTD